MKSMASVEFERLQDPEHIFVARSLRVSLTVEEWLTTAGIDYVVKVEPVGRSLLFGTSRMGVVFYVNAGQAAYCREQLAAGGFERGVAGPDEHRPG
jgi:hypothetical protein